MMYFAIYVAVTISLLLFVPFIRGMFPGVTEQRISGPYKNIPGMLDDMFNGSKAFLQSGMEVWLLVWPALFVFSSSLFTIWLVCNAFLIIGGIIMWPFTSMDSIFERLEALGQKTKDWL